MNADLVLENMICNKIYPYYIIRSLTRFGMYLFFSCISPNPNLGYTMPPIPGMIPFSLSLRVSIANVKKLNLSDMEAGN